MVAKDARIYLDDESMVLEIGGKMILEAPRIYYRQSLNMCLARAKSHGVTLDRQLVNETLERKGEYDTEGTSK